MRLDRQAVRPDTDAVQGRVLMRWFWDTHEEPLPGMSRRRFLFLGAAAGAVAVVAPETLLYSGIPPAIEEPVRALWDGDTHTVHLGYSECWTEWQGHYYYWRCPPLTPA